jgi:hypothetical protein
VRILTFLLLLGCLSAAPRLPARQVPLQGIDTVYILVEGLTPAGREAGLTREDIEDAVSLELRKARIRVVPKNLDLPEVYVNVNMIKDQGIGAYVYSISVQVNQTATLLRDPSIVVDATTWEKGLVGISGRGVVRTGVRDGLRDLSDNLANDILAANQK